MITKLKLDRLAELKAQQDILRMRQQELIDSVLTTEIQNQIAEIDEEFAPQFETLRKNKAELEKRIKEEVIVHGETIKGNLLQGVWVKARISWETKGLDGYAIDHPELNQFRKIGKPSVSIRKVG